MERPRVVLSRCLELAECRYDGGGIRSDVVRMLAGEVEFVPVCPEVRIGLGVPRAPIQIEEEGGTQRLVQPSTGRDLTELMAGFGESFADAHPAVDGVLLKSRSPSCGIDDVKIYEGGALREDRGMGMFARVMAARYPHLPMEDEARLEVPAVLESWLERVRMAARWRVAVHRGPSDDGRSGLRALHQDHVLTAERLPAEVRGALDRLVVEASSSPSDYDAIARRYRDALLRGMAAASVSGRR
jgi:uncharacterized protein YbbK (DUF523 family)